MTVDPRDELYRLAQAVNEANFGVQIAATKMYGLMIWMDPIPDDIYAEMFRAIGQLRITTDALETNVTGYQRQEKGRETQP
jgi:hypothetical protein